MKKNGNDKRKGNYYIGLDVGTDSVGWAVTDRDYSVLRFKGKSMWGARLFEAANDASERRVARTSRRRLNRRKQRILILEELFAKEILKKDPNFFVRLHESNLWQEDRTDKNCSYVLFNDPHYTDKDYLREYPTVYHLREDLIHNAQPHDPRLVFLALHHIFKSRGHFLYEGSENSEEGKTLEESFNDLQLYLSDYDISFAPGDMNSFIQALSDDSPITVKKKKLAAAYGGTEKTEEGIDIASVVELLSGATVKLSKLYGDDSLKNTDVTSVSLKDDIDAKYDQLAETLDDDRLELILSAKELFDIARLRQFLGENRYLSEAKVELYEKNRQDLKILKKYIRKNRPQEYKDIFNAKEGVKNYAAYSRYKTKNRCTQEEFCSFLKGKTEGMKNSKDPDEKRIYEEINAKTFLPRLKGSDNGVIPYQLHLKELKAILNNAETYLPFLKEKDDDGITVQEKLISTYTFRIPYFVGPLNRRAKHSWVVRSDEKIYPWNFTKVVDEEKSAQEFMDNLIGRCTYTKEPVLPMNSLLYSEYKVLNELNPMMINGQPVPADVKNKVYEDLFVNSNRKVTKKSIFKYLLANGHVTEQDQLSGIDDTIKSNLKSYHDFKDILAKTKDYEQTERIIRSMVVFSSDKKMLRKWLDKNTHGLSEEDKKKVVRLNYKEWGNLSKEFLTEIYSPDENGEVMNIIEKLRSSNLNLMKLLSKDFEYRDQVNKYLTDHGYVSDSIHTYLDELYIAPAVKRSIWQTLRIVDEIIDIQKSAPEKIFIEMARPDAKTVKKERTESRKDALLKLYKSCGEQVRDLQEKLEHETDQSLRRDKLYLYYTQMGRCMYTGEPIDLEKMLKDNTTYDIDHIYPRSRIKDDSLTNRVLVKSSVNREKTNIYPISDQIRSEMYPFWTLLKEKKLISEEKYRRLTRSYELTPDELASFVARQITVTQQSTKALAQTLEHLYGNTRIVYSKAGNVSEFRHKYGFVKMREVNDLHHAKDAYLNVVVGNVYDTKFTAKFFNNITKEIYSLNKVFDFNTVGAWKKDGSTLANVRKYMAKNNPIVTFMPVIVKGAISDLQIMPKGKGQLPVKQGRDVEKYGGYNKISGAYFAVIEHQKGKKTLRTIVPVFIHDEEKYRRDPVGYFESYGFVNPRVIAARIPFNALLELNDKRLCITGRTGNQIVYKHTYELAIDDEHVHYLKDIKKYVDRCKAQKSELEITDRDGITSDKNVMMYDWFITRLEMNVYKKMFTPMLDDMGKYRAKYIAFTEYTQCHLLLEILKAFKCDRQCPNLKELNGKATAGIVFTSNNIQGNDTAYLINQSVTGLFEYKVDLLK